MKNDKILSGVAYMFLGAALLISGPKVQEQIDSLASDPNVQMAKVLFQSAMEKAGAKAEAPLLVMNQDMDQEKSIAVVEDEVAAEAEAVQAMAKPRARVSVRTRALPMAPVIAIQVPAPPTMDLVTLSRAQRAEIAAMNAQLAKANFEEAAQRASEVQRLVMLRANGLKTIKCDKTEIKTEL